MKRISSIGVLALSLAATCLSFVERVNAQSSPPLPPFIGAMNCESTQLGETGASLTNIRVWGTRGGTVARYRWTPAFIFGQDLADAANAVLLPQREAVQSIPPVTELKDFEEFVGRYAAIEAVVSDVAVDGIKVVSAGGLPIGQLAFNEPMFEAYAAGRVVGMDQYVRFECDFFNATDFEIQLKTSDGDTNTSKVSYCQGMAVDCIPEAFDFDDEPPANGCG